MKEKMLVLAKAYPVTSSKYANLVCVGGTTEKGELRRIYPVSWKLFWNEGGFRKKHWIEYEVIGRKPEDKRKESLKIDENSIVELKEENWKNIKKLILPHITTYEELARLVKTTDISMGIIKPNIIDFVVKRKPFDTLRKLKNKLFQTSLESDFGKGDIRHASKVQQFEESFCYIFSDDDGKTTHTISCIDWEIGALYRRYSDKKVGFEKTRDRFLSFIKSKPEVYFVLGTHHVYKTIMIIGILYPKKADLQSSK